uniref:Uncharacterized protein n=1 Tax=Romanomermis culicivorax TaxID=13658 RepID=A0A915L8Q4_ROMCU
MARRIGFIPEKCMLKATVSAMWAFSTQPNGFRDLKTLMRTMHPKILTALKVRKKKNKKQKDEWNKSLEVSNDKDPLLQAKSLKDDTKRLQVDGEWFWGLTTCMPPAAALASLCSAAEYAYINDVLARHAQSLDRATCTTFHACMWYPADGDPRTRLTDWMNGIPQCKPAFDHEPGTYICNCFPLCPIILDEDFHIDTAMKE